MRMAFRALLLLCTFLISNHCALSQTEIDSLLIVLKTTKGDEKVNTLNNLSIAYRNRSLPHSMEYAEQAIKLAEKLNYRIGIGDGLRNKGIVFYLQNKYEDAILEYKKAFDLFKKVGNHDKLSAILNNRAIIWVIQGKYDEALEDYQKSVEINLKQRNYKRVSNIYNNIGMVYTKQGNIEKSLEYYNKSLEIALQDNNVEAIESNYNNLGLIYKSLGSLDVALEYYQKAIKIIDETGNMPFKAKVLTNMASVFSELQENDKAIELLGEAIKIEEDLNYDQGVLKSNTRIGWLLLKMEKYEKANEHFKKALDFAINNDYKDQMIGAYILLGRSYYEMANYSKALEYFELSLEIALDVKSVNYEAKLYQDIGNCYHKINNIKKATNYLNRSFELAEQNNFIDLAESTSLKLSELYNQIRDYKNAYSYQLKYIEIHNYIYNKVNQKKLAELQTQFETEKKEKEILQLREEKRKVRQSYISIGISSTIFTLLIIIALLLNRFRLKKKSVMMLDAKNILLEKANKELIIAKNKAEESDRLKTAFLANISHEIRTPMNAIIGFTEFLSDPEISKEQKNELYELVNLNGEMLLSLIDDIIDIAKLESGQLTVLKEPVKLCTLVEETFQLMKAKKELKKSNLRFEYLRAKNSNLEVFTDAYRLKQILVNLIDNAIKFTKSGEIIFGYEKLNGDQKVTFKVGDTGIGIDPKYHDKIFKMFYKAPTDNSVIYRGTGIGLSIAKSLIEQLGGEIWLDSEVNKGTIFYFTIPTEIKQS